MFNCITPSQYLTLELVIFGIRSCSLESSLTPFMRCI